MKKLFALTLVAAMLSLAGIATATTITASPATVSVAQDATATVTLTGTPSHPGGRIEAYAIDGPSWMTLSGTTVTLAPTTSDPSKVYTAKVTATETYIADDEAGHGTRTETATSTITVTVTAKPNTLQIVKQTVVKTVTVVRRTVIIISPTAQKSAVVETFAQVTRTVTELITTTVLESVEGFTAQLARRWAAKSAVVEAKRVAFVETVAANPAFRRQVFPGLAESAVVTPRSNTLLNPVATSSTASSATKAQKLAAATEALGDPNARALSATEAVSPSESGAYTFPKTFGSDLYGTKIKGHKGLKSTSSSTSGLMAAAVDSEGVAFLNSSGDVVDYIPGAESSDDIMPGFVNMVVVMIAGQVYEPVVVATTEDLAAAGVSDDATPVSVDINQVEYAEEEKLVVSDADGKTTETVIEEASDAAVEGMTEALGVEPKFVSLASMDISTDISAASAVDSVFAASNDLYIAAMMRPMPNLPDGVYYTNISFFERPSKLKSGATLVFYPDGLTNDGATMADESAFGFRLFTTTSGDEITAPADAFGKELYITFEVASAVLKAANNDNTLTRPIVVTQLTPSSTSPDKSGDVKPVSPDKSGDVTPTSPDRSLIGVGGSSGGCSAGSALFALALLGTFIASRKK